MKTAKSIFLLSILLSLAEDIQSRCDRTPEGNYYPKTQQNGRFSIHISGSPDRYVPGERYTVFLRGSMTHMVQNKFKDFLLIADQETFDPYMRDSSSKPFVGTFTLHGDTLTKFNEKCPHSVMQTNSLPKTEVQVSWRAPPSGSGCVAFRATIVELKNLWYMDDGDLTKVLCEDMSVSDDVQPMTLDHCCACDEAKYEIIFEGLWSRNSHPKDFPSNSWLTRFSDIVGASHGNNYTFWSPGVHANEGMRVLAEHGSTTKLERELIKNSNSIRTIIKARGISYPNVTGKTFTIFKTDNQHHRMSFVSVINPSPDWFLGVSDLELCQVDCTWASSVTLNLYPFDAGVDDGYTYISPKQPSSPTEPIRRIRPNRPNDPRSPFYDASGAEMKPMARLYVNRIYLYGEKCDSSELVLPSTTEAAESSEEIDVGIPILNSQKSGEEYMVIHEPIGPVIDCQVSRWSRWSECNATEECSTGYITKHRQIKVHPMNGGEPCPKKLFKTKKCETPCSVNEESNEHDMHHHSLDPTWGPAGPEDGEKTDCEMSHWSHWSPCSHTCGIKSLKIRTRKIIKYPSGGGETCMHRVDTKQCNVLPCPVDD